MKSGFARWALLAALCLPSAAALAQSGAGHSEVPPDVSFSEYVPGASRLEGRLLAPCCWDSSRQTLDIHGSPIANELRTEIRKRLKAGEQPDAIEADLVHRYTTKILAVPPDSPLPRMGPILAVGLVGAGAFAASILAKWRKRSRDVAKPRAAAAGGAPVSDEWDKKLDQELEDDGD